MPEGGAGLWEWVWEGMRILGGVAVVAYTYMHNRLSNLEKKVEANREKTETSYRAEDDKLWAEVAKLREQNTQIILMIGTKVDKTDLQATESRLMNAIKGGGDD